jgi:hypothetical protein
VRSAPAKADPTIECNVDGENHSSNHELGFSGEAGRINDWQQIVLNEAFGIARQARLDTKVVLQVREGTNAACEFNEESPCGCRKMNKDDPAPPRRNCGTQEGKHDERQVDQQNSFGGQSEEHDYAWST